VLKVVTSVTQVGKKEM